MQVSWLFSSKKDRAKQTDFFDSLNTDNELVLQESDFTGKRNLKPVNQKSTGQETYQVQFYTTRNKAKASNEMKRVQDALNIKVTLSYESPYYKLRTNGVSSRQKAEKIKNILIEAGHKDAWIITNRN